MNLFVFLYFCLAVFPTALNRFFLAYCCVEIFLVFFFLQVVLYWQLRQIRDKVWKEFLMNLKYHRWHVTAQNADIRIQLQHCPEKGSHAGSLADDAQ